MVHSPRTRSIAAKEMLPLFGQMPVYKGRSWLSQTNHIRCEECGDDRHRHHNGIKEIASHLQRNAQRSNDKGKLAYLRQAKAALHGYLQWLAGQQHTQRAEQSLTKYYGQCDGYNGPRIFHQHLRIYHHAYRYEKDSTKQVFQRLNQPFYLLASTVSARIEPMIKAPNAAEKPVCSAT